MKICLAGTYSRPFLFKDSLPIYTLESFYYIQNWQLPMIPDCDLFLLDSGAFTFMESTNTKHILWDSYLEKYAQFINDNNIKYFFELDIDSIVGYNKVIQFREFLETKTNKKCIPVWHKSRGLQNFIETCENYDYIAIGGLVSKEILKSEYIFLKKLIEIAHQNNTKIHGLGFSDYRNLSKFNFDSVDSTSWLQGGRFGSVSYFTGKAIKRISLKNSEKKIDYRRIDGFNLNEWKKFQQYATNNY